MRLSGWKAADRQRSVKTGQRDDWQLISIKDQGHLFKDQINYPPLQKKKKKIRSPSGQSLKAVTFNNPDLTKAAANMKGKHWNSPPHIVSRQSYDLPGWFTLRTSPFYISLTNTVEATHLCGHKNETYLRGFAMIYFVCVNKILAGLFWI